MKKFVTEIIDILKELSDNGAIIYGRSSLFLRNQFLGRSTYRLSRDIDLNKIVDHSEEINNIGPISQFKPFDINKFLKDKFNGNKFEIERLKNNGPSLTKEHLLRIDGYGEIILEFYADKNVNIHEFENLNGINLAYVEKVFADKVFASIDYYLTGNLEQENRIRHVIDVLHIVKTYVLDLGLISRFISDRLNKELKNIDKPKVSKSKKELLKNICSNFKKASISFFSEILLNDDNEINKEFNEAFKKDPLYEKSNFLTKKTYSKLIKTLEDYNE